MILLKNQDAGKPVVKTQRIERAGEPQRSKSRGVGLKAYHKFTEILEEQRFRNVVEQKL
jgi:hypothetical protein